MKKKLFKKVAAIGLAALTATCLLSGCGGSGNDSANTANTADTAAAGNSETPSSETAEAAGSSETPGSNGTIMWLLSAQFKEAENYAKAVCEALGYNFTVVYGDSYNDPAGNLSAVKNGMTSDVKGIIAGMDGGIINILEEYPDIYLCGFNSDMASVYTEDGPSADALNNDHFLGTIVDGYASGVKTGHDYAQEVINNGYTKVSTIIFPGYAYPQLPIADQQFRTEIEEYNSTADTPIEVVGEAKVLEFTPLDESYFMEAEYQDLDAIVAFCSDQFIYPGMVAAMASGVCSADTKLLSSGWDNDEGMVAAIGDTIAFLSGSPVENLGYAIIMLDNAINGLSYPDAANPPERIDSVRVNLRTQEDAQLLKTGNVVGTGNPDDAWVSIDEVKNLCLRFNPDATYADLLDLYSSEQLTIEGHK